MKTIWETWIRPLPFKDVQGNHLKIADFVWRIESGNMVLAIITKISQGGSLCIKSAFPLYHNYHYANGNQSVKFNNGYAYEEEYLEDRKIWHSDGHLNSWSPSKLLKVDIRSLNEFQTEIINRLKNAL